VARAGLVCAALLLVGAPARADESPYDFELYDLSDKLVSLARLRGSAKLVLVDFFSEVCQPCKAALPRLRRLHQRWAAKGLALVIVAVPGDSEDRAQSLRATEQIFAGQPMPFPVVWDKYRRVAAQYKVMRDNTLKLPQAFLLSAKGALLRKAVAAAALEPELARRLR
jgi:peroxiredoxin